MYNNTRSGIVLLALSRYAVGPLLRRHNGRDGVSNHQPHHCLLNRLLGHRSKKTSKLHVTDRAGNSLVSGELSAQMASNAENVSIWWRYHRTVLHIASKIYTSGNEVTPQNMGKQVARISQQRLHKNKTEQSTNMCIISVIFCATVPSDGTLRWHHIGVKAYHIIKNSTECSPACSS